jgi:sugar phosphate permease
MADVDNLLNADPSANLGDKAPARPTQVRYVVLVILCTLALITYLHRVGFAVGGPRIKDQLQLDDVQMANLLTVFFIAYAGFQIPGGWLVDSFGARHLLTLLMAGSSITTGLIALVVLLPDLRDEFLVLLVLRFLFGMFQAGIFPVVARINSDWVPITLRAVAQGAVWMSSRAGGALAPLILVPLFALCGNWQIPFVIIGVVGLAWCVVFWVWFRNRPEEKAGVNSAEVEEIRRGRAASTLVRQPVPWSRLFGSRNAWFLSLGYGFSGISGNFYIGWLPTYLENHRHIATETVKWMTSLPLAFAVVTCLIGGVISDAIVRKTGSRCWGRRINAMVGRLIAAVALGVTPWVDNVLALTILFTLAFAASDLAMAPTWAACSDIGEQAAGTLGGTMNMVSNFGGALGSYAAGKFLQAQLPDWLFVFYGASYFLAALCWLGVDADKPLVERSKD